jgi:hypothetical protein
MLEVRRRRLLGLDKCYISRYISILESSTFLQNRDMITGFYPIVHTPTQRYPDLYHYCFSTQNYPYVYIRGDKSPRLSSNDNFDDQNSGQWYNPVYSSAYVSIPSVRTRSPTLMMVNDERWTELWPILFC